MGTEFEYAINLLAKSPISDNKSSPTNTIYFCSVNDWDCKIGICRSHHKKQEDGRMDRNEEIPDIEYIKKTMQMHEDIFKQQVRELHRLYNVQRTLMTDVRKQLEQTRRWTPLANTTPSATNMNSGEWPVPSPENFNLGRHLRDVSTDQDNGVGCSMQEHDVDLTLSIGSNMSMRTPKIEVENKLAPSLSIESDQGGPNIDKGGSAGTSDRERKRPHWLFQV